MATVTQAEVEATIGRKLTWFERLGFWWEALTAKADNQGLVEDQDSIFYGGFTATGDFADWWSQTPTGQIGADIGEMTITLAEETTKRNWWAIGGISAAGLLGAYAFGRLK